MSKIHIFEGYHHGSLLIKDGELFFNNGLEESAHAGQDGKGYRQLVDDCTREIARLVEHNKKLEAVAAAAKELGHQHYSDGATKNITWYALSKALSGVLK